MKYNYSFYEKYPMDLGTSTSISLASYKKYLIYRNNASDELLRIDIMQNILKPLYGFRFCAGYSGIDDPDLGMELSSSSDFIAKVSAITDLSIKLSHDTYGQFFTQPEHSAIYFNEPKNIQLFYENNNWIYHKKGDYPVNVQMASIKFRMSIQTIEREIMYGAAIFNYINPGRHITPELLEDVIELAKERV